MTAVSLNLLVLRSADVERSLAFYQTLGLTFVKEQHGNGPVHYACELGTLVIEIYPGKPGTALDNKSAGAVRLGFEVANVDSTIQALQNIQTVVLTAPQENAWGRRAVVQDPDSRAVELTQKS